jgi:competence protein ComEC
LWLEWRDQIEKKDIKSTNAIAGQVIELGGDTKIEVVSPLPDSDMTDNENGIVLKVSDGNVSFLLTADIPQEIEMYLLTGKVHLDSTVLKVSHHGSEYASSTGFLASVNPEIAVISVGADNDYGHPAKETLARLTDEVGQENIYRTDRGGTIEFITDGKRLWLKKDR